MKKKLLYFLIATFAFSVQAQITVNTQNITVNLDTSGQASITPEDINDGSTSISCVQGMDYEGATFTISVGSSGSIGYNSGFFGLGAAEEVELVQLNGLDNKVRAGDELRLRTITTRFGEPEGRSPFYRIDSDDIVWEPYGGTRTPQQDQIINQTGKNTGEIIDFSQPFSLVFSFNNEYFEFTAEGRASTSSTVTSLTAQLVSGDLGTTDPCAITSLSLDQTSFDCSNAGSNSVILTVSDSQGNTAMQTATVTIEDNTPATISCPANITQTSTDTNGLAVSYNLPSITDNCINGGTITSGEEIITPEGSTYLGTFNGSIYFISDSAPMSNTNYDNAWNLGLNLTSIESAEENAFIAQQLTNNNIGSAQIGFDDLDLEGTFEWQDGTAVTYINWNSGEPNDFGAGEDYTIIFNDGTWNDTSSTASLRYITEISLNTLQKPANSTLLGIYNGSTYFISNNVTTASNAFAITNNSGLNLLTINNEAENSFIAQMLTEAGISRAITGYNDVESENNFIWQSGAETPYTNWSPNEPSNSNGNENYAEVGPSGSWNDISGSTNLRYIIEIPSTILQTAGLAIGNQFPIGSTTNSFSYFDIDGSEADCSFNVQVSLPAPVIQNEQPYFIQLNSIPQTVTNTELNVETTFSSNVSISPYTVDCNSDGLITDVISFEVDGSQRGGANAQSFQAISSGFLKSWTGSFRYGSTTDTQAVINLYRNNNSNSALATDVELYATFTIQVPGTPGATVFTNSIGITEFTESIYLEKDRMYMWQVTSGPEPNYNTSGFAYREGTNFNYTTGNPVILNESNTPSTALNFAYELYGIDNLTSDIVNVSTQNTTTTVNDNVNVYYVYNETPNVVTQNIIVSLDQSGSATITPQDVDNGSSISCSQTPLLSLDKTTFDCSNTLGNYTHSLDFNNTGVEVSLNNKPSGNDARTISFWVKSNVDIPSNNQRLFFDYGSNFTGQSTAIGTRNGGIYLETYNRDIDVAIPVVQNQWFHLTMTHNGSQTIFYYNGQSVGELNFPLITTNNNLFLGRSRNGGSNFNGNMSNLKIYNTALTPEQVRQDMLSELSVNPANLTYMFDFNQATGNALSTGNTAATINVGAPSNSLQYDTDFPENISTATPILFTVADGLGNSVTETVLVNIVDILPPTITLNGNTIVNITVGDVYNELGASATDNCTSSLTAIIGGDIVDTNTAGTYLVTYNASDTRGNASPEIVRTVIVEESTVLSINSFDSNLEDQIRIYPNPVKKSEDIIINFSDLEGAKQLKLFSLSGKLVFKAETNEEGNYILNTSYLPTAIYFLEVTNKNSRITKKIVIQ